MKEFGERVKEYAEEPLTRPIIMDLLKGYKRPNDKLNDLVKKGVLTSVKRGLYIPGPRLGIQRPEPFLLANHLWGPSYVSMESALSFWGLIPERTYAVSSVTTKASKTYNTAAGTFIYLHSSLPYYALGVQSITLTARQVALVASPEKALCDKIIMTSGVYLRSLRQVREFLFEDMRIDEDALTRLNTSVIGRWISAAPKKKSLQMLVKTIEER